MPGITLNYRLGGGWEARGPEAQGTMQVHLHERAESGADLPLAGRDCFVKVKSIH